MFAPKLRESNNTWQFRDIEEMAQYANTSPVLLDADASMVVLTIDVSLYILHFIATTVIGGPIGGQTRISLRNDHLQYVFTWLVGHLLVIIMINESYHQVRVDLGHWLHAVQVYQETKTLIIIVSTQNNSLN